MTSCDLDSIIEPLRDYVARLAASPPPRERTDQLASSAQFIKECLHAQKPANLLFICAHNSRRSHLAHVWADTAARYHGLTGVRTYSGGTETSECNHRTIRALRRAGLSIVRSEETTNPAYLVQGFEDSHPVKCFSKIYSECGNPTSDFAAMMCCSDVDEACPVIDGASLRVPLHYNDPKESDGTPREVECYDERCEQIARDMFWLMSLVRQ